MFCHHCNSHLSKCTCEDLEKRLDSVVKKGLFDYNKCTICKKHYERCQCKKPQLMLASLHPPLKETEDEKSI
jgi:hypothetical protein